MKRLYTRKSIRLDDYDYADCGRYFVTLCTVNRIEWLGSFDVGQGLCSCRLSETGHIVESELLQLENRYDNIKIDKYVIMPNHIHVVIIISERREQSPRPTLMDVICAYKSITAKSFNKLNDCTGKVLWQSRFHDRIIRNEAEYRAICRYIDENPARWENDEYFVRGSH